MMKERILAIFMAIAIIFCYMPSTAFAVNASNAREIVADDDLIAEDEVSALADMPKEGFWSTEALKAAVNNKLLNGFAEDGKTYIKPNDPLTRAQMATIVNRAFGAKETASLSVASDVPADAWYYKDMQKAVKMGTMKLDAKMRPNDSITRQEAFTILGRALKMKDGSKTDLSKFNDSRQVADWAINGMGTMIKAGYIKGDNNLLSPAADMTRAQFATIMNNVIKEYIKSPGTIKDVKPGNIMINVDGVTLKNLTVDGDLIIGDGVGDGTVTLKEVVIKGNIIARGGGAESIIITGGSVGGKIIIAKIDGKIRVFTEGGAEIKTVEIDDGKDDVIIEGTVGTLEVTSADTPVIIRNANIDRIEVNTDGASNTTIEKDSKAKNLVIGAGATGSKIDVAGTVTNFETSAKKTRLSGTGEVTNAKVKDGANDTSISTPNTAITNDGASTVTGGGGTAIPANTSVTNNGKGTGITTSSDKAGGSGGKSKPAYDSAVQDNTDIATAKINIESETYSSAQVEAGGEAAALAKAQALVDLLELEGTTAEVVAGTFNAATVGTEENAEGTPGTYTFTVIIDKGKGTQVTSAEQTMTIIARTYEEEQIRRINKVSSEIIPVSVYEAAGITGISDNLKSEIDEYWEQGDDLLQRIIQIGKFKKGWADLTKVEIQGYVTLLSELFKYDMYTEGHIKGEYTAVGTDITDRVLVLYDGETADPDIKIEFAKYTGLVYEWYEDYNTYTPNLIEIINNRIILKELISFRNPPNFFYSEDTIPVYLRLERNGLMIEWVIEFYVERQPLAVLGAEIATATFADASAKTVKYTITDATVGATYKVYDAKIAGSLAAGVTAAVVDKTLTLTFDVANKGGTYYIETVVGDKVSETRLAVTTVAFE